MGPEATCKTVVDRGSDYCSWHSAKLVEQYADEFEAKAGDGLTLDVALELPMLDRPLGQMSLEERRGLWTYIERKYPLIGG